MNKIFPAARYAAIIAVALLAFACRTAKHSADNQPYTDETEQTVTATGAFSLQTVAETVPEWTDVTISGKLTINSGKSSISSPVILKMVNDKMISISIRPILGIEMGKIYITNDSLVAVDKYHKTYFTENIASLVGFDLDVASLQALFLSRPFQPGEGPITDKNRKKFNATNPDTDGIFCQLLQTGLTAVHTIGRTQIVSHLIEEIVTGYGDGSADIQRTMGAWINPASRAWRDVFKNTHTPDIIVTVNYAFLQRGCGGNRFKSRTRRRSGLGGAV